jgi:ribosomal protein RSM22 (predicted rRNA methylase)
MELLRADWDRLRLLRSAFLERAESARPEALPDYWRSTRDLELYEAIFGQRIAWRWEAVLAELATRGFPSRPAVVLDWGCGTGAAARAWLEHFGADGLQALHLVDRSDSAARYAAERLRPLAGTARIAFDPPAACDLLLVSHVLDEAGLDGRVKLLDMCSRARSVVWLEPGTPSTSKALVELREELRAEFALVAPCPQRGACGMLLPGHERDWCHHFATPPRSIFQDPFWGAAARELGIDLRSLPYAFLALVRAADAGAAPPPEVGRVLGRPRIEKGRARIDLCTSSGVATRHFLERNSKERFEELSESPERARLYRVEEQDGRISALQPWP